MIHFYRRETLNEIYVNVFQGDSFVQNLERANKSGDSARDPTRLRSNEANIEQQIGHFDRTFEQNEQVPSEPRGRKEADRGQAFENFRKEDGDVRKF